MITDREILVFVHIEKAAGTTLNYILRRNFLFRHYDIRPFFSESNRRFQLQDFRLALRVNPFVKSISGHSLAPFIRLEHLVPNIRYVTLLRDPVERYISHFYYWNIKLKKEIMFEEFLEMKRLHNFQTRKIAGCEDYMSAKRILKNKFFLVGVVEEFDEFLLVLKKKLARESFDLRYQKQNTAVGQDAYKKTKSRILRNYYGEIIARNELDIKLYKYVKNVLFHKEKKLYGPKLVKDLQQFRFEIKNFKWPVVKYLDFAYRKFYLDFVTGFIRLKNDLPYRGSY